ncbi:MAG TPA: hypothetical protein PKO09_00220 [Anaerolineae bacterium]|nr:hypothetical protein [Anaerolineae bacterium]
MDDEPVAARAPLGDEQAPRQPALLSRRRFLSGALAGSAAGVALAAGTALGAYQLAEVHEQEALAAAEAEIARLKGLLQLYEKLEKVGLDAILKTGMAALVGPLELVQKGAQLLGKGLEWLEAAALALRDALPSASEAFSWLREQVSGLTTGIEQLQAAVDRLLGKASDHPIAVRLTEAFHWVLDRLPFELGNKVSEAFDRLHDLVGSVDDLVRGVDERFLEPVERSWFSREVGADHNLAPLDLLVERILDPLEAHLAAVGGLIDAWQAELAAPAQQALAERERLRGEIAEYRARNGLPH